MNRWVVAILPVFVVGLWGSSFTLIALALRSFTPLDLMVLRFGMAAVCYVVLLGFRVIRFVPIERQDWPRFLAMTAALVIGYNVFLTTAQVHLPANLAILVGQAAPVLVLLIERLATGSFQVGRPGVALGTWLIGTLIVLHNFTKNLTVAGGWPLGMLCLTPLAMASYMVLARPLVQRYGGANICAQMFVTGGVGLAISLAWRPTFWAQVGGATTESLVAVGVLVGCTTVLAYTLWFALLRVLGASAVAGYLNLVPVTGCALAALVLQETLSAQALVGGVLVVLGCGLSTTRREPDNDEPEYADEPEVNDKTKNSCDKAARLFGLDDSSTYPVRFSSYDRSS